MKLTLLLSFKFLIGICILFMLINNFGCTQRFQSVPDQNLVKEIEVLKDSVSLLIEKLNYSNGFSQNKASQEDLRIHRKEQQFNESADSLLLASKEFFDYYYLLIKSIYLGKDWVDENDNQLFYRVIISSIGEMGFVHIELIRIGPETDYLTLISRRFLDPRKFHRTIFRHTIEFIEWITPSLIKVRLDENVHTINLNDLFTIPVDVPS